MTEVYVPNSTSDADTWPEAVDVAKNMHDGFVTGNMQTYVWWYIRRSYGPMKENGQISKRGYCMAQYSKFVRPGYKRVDATENPNTNIWVSAYTGNNKAVIVAVNKGNSEVSQKFTVQNGQISTVDRYRTTGSENLAKTSNLALSGNGFWANLPANSISTFVCTLGGGQPTVTPTQGGATGLPSGVTAEYKIVSDWGSNFQGEIVIKNTSTKTFNGWTLTCNYNSSIQSLWGAELVGQSGTKVTIRNPSWDATLAPGASVSINFIANTGSDKNAPTGYTFG